MKAEGTKMSLGVVRAWLTAGCVGAIVLCSATMATAQAVRAFDDLRASLRPSARIVVTEQTGTTIEGRLVSLSPQSLRIALRAGGITEISESSVAKIERLKSRAAKGALVGLVAGAVAGAIAVAVTPPCRGFCIGPRKEVVILPIAGLLGGIGAGIGAGIGKGMTDRRTIYLAPVPCC